jgi:hypothetical protein
MWPYAIPYHVVRIAEMRPTLIVLAVVMAIAILIWRKPEHYVLWAAAVVIAAISWSSRAIGAVDDPYVVVVETSCAARSSGRTTSGGL